MTIARFRERVGLVYKPMPMYAYGTGTNPTWYWQNRPISAITASHEKCWDETHPGPPYKTGGPLNLWRFEFSSPIFGGLDVQSRVPPNVVTYWWKGSWWVQPLSETDFPLTGWGTTWGDATSAGPVGWDKFKPAKPGVDLGVALAELRETFGSLVKRAKIFKAGRVQNPAKTLLESNFGWIPLANDIEKAIHTFRNLDNMIDRIRKMNGRWEHRGGTVSKEKESWETETGPRVNPVLQSGFYTSAGLSSPYVPNAKIKWEYESVTWFEGMFKYYIPNIHSEEWESTARRKLMGLTLNASTLWELLPYSWLADWISNAGSVFSNMDPGLAENLVCQYAFVMRRSTLTATMTQEHKFRAPYTGPVTTNSHVITHKWERKHRVKATPFGFGLNIGSFSPKQIAIMAALGLSR